MEEIKYQTRRRVKFTQSTKDKISVEVSCEMIDGTRAEVLKEAGLLLNEAIVLAKYRESELNK